MERDRYPRDDSDPTRERSAYNVYGPGAGYGYVGTGQPAYRPDAEARRYGYGDGKDRDLWEKTKDEVSSWFGDDDASRRRRMDQRGRGPRGYRRTDSRILEDVGDRITDDWMLDASEIEVAVSNSEVTLSGEVDTRRDKHRAEDIAEGVAGVGHVQNNLRVRTPGPEAPLLY